MDKKNVPVDLWEKCYPSNWKGMIVPEAITHPAKYSSKLIRRIYEHITACGWIVPGSTVFDPFGGVALGALDAMRLGYSWRGVELEERFAAIGNKNIEMWNARYSSMPGWSQDAVLLRGDSTGLFRLLSADGQDASISSPPFGEAQSGGGIASSVRGESAYEVTGGTARTKRAANSAVGFGYQGQGNTDGNLSALPITSGGFLTAVSSPPFLQSKGGKGVSEGMDPSVLKRHAAGNGAASAYGLSDGQLTNLPEGDFDAAISSPPFENSLSRDYLDADQRRAYARSNGIENSENVSPIDLEKVSLRNQTYGEANGNIGNSQGEDFWSAARLIVEQTYKTLAPGGHAVWVVKDFVKGGKIVPFSDQWRQLCEAVGFVTLHEHHALFTRSFGTSHTLEGGEVKHVKSSKSFFRRVAEKKGSPPIDFEVILCMEKK